MAITLEVNGRTRSVDVDPQTPLLWVLRDTLGLTGTKFGCGISACGACTVHLDGRAVRTCTLPVSAAEGASITTIEGLAQDGALHNVQQAWIDNQVPQCGYCQSGMIMAVSALLEQRPDPSDEQIDAAITNICRCGTFVRIRRAIHAVAKAGKDSEARHG
ncbi:MAG: (2Fe-2S)-binding protein [Acidobacteria bacterium]|nr:(2Fe-2S)-binding protein [Acidobacteriota bacterium]